MSAELKLAKAAELEALAAKLRAEVEAETPKKWEPKGGCYYVATTGSIGEGEPDEWYSGFGVERETYQQATKDAARMRKFNRLLCWMVENDWDSGIDVYIDNGGDVCLCFNESGYLSSELMRGIANGVIEL